MKRVGRLGLAHALAVAIAVTAFRVQTLVPFPAALVPCGAFPRSPDPSKYTLAVRFTLLLSQPATRIQICVVAAGVRHLCCAQHRVFAA